MELSLVPKLTHVALTKVWFVMRGRSLYSLSLLLSPCLSRCLPPSLSLSLSTHPPSLYLSPPSLSRSLFLPLSRPPSLSLSLSLFTLSCASRSASETPSVHRPDYDSLVVPTLLTPLAFWSVSICPSLALAPSLFPAPA